MQKQLVTLHVHLFLRSNSQSHRGDSIAIYLATRARPDPSISSFAITAVQVGDKIPPAWESNRIFRERHKLKLTSQFHAILLHQDRTGTMGISQAFPQFGHRSLRICLLYTWLAGRSCMMKGGPNERTVDRTVGIRSMGKCRLPTTTWEFDHLLCNYRLIVWRSCR